MAFVQNEDPVEALISDGPDEPLGVGIGSRYPPRRAKDPDPLGLEHLVKGGAEPVITVVDEKLDRTIRTSDRLRATWVHQDRLVAPSVTPPIRTCRVFRSMKKITWSVFSLIDSTVKRSQAMIEAAWFRMN
ncbi:MAG: hypothetical protein WBG41_10075 [Acidimicrobiales bacterium]